MKRIIYDFFYLAEKGKIEIYNEFSLQHELGVYLRSREEFTRFKIQFERNVRFFGIQKTTTKKEIDIVIFDESQGKYYSIELKFPSNGQYPESMFSFVKDIKLCEELYQNGFNESFAVTVVQDKLFYSGGFPSEIYKFFRGNKPIHGIVQKPTGQKNVYYNINGTYPIKWENKNGNFSFYIVSSGDSLNQVKRIASKVGIAMIYER